MKKIIVLLIAILATMSINAQIVKVYQNGELTDTYNFLSSKKAGKVVAQKDNNVDAQVVEVYQNGELSKSYTNTATNPVKVVFEDAYVDLGLSVKWAICNVGAENCYDYGDYFAWGETEGKTTFSWSYYTLCNSSSSSMTRYCTSSSYGTVDDKKVLESTDDAATANWGSKWRMPTYDELSELNNSSNCSWTWYDAGNAEFNGVAGYKVQSLKDGYTDKYIFLPAAGYYTDSGITNVGTICGYWSSSLHEDNSSKAEDLGFGNFYHDMFVDLRYHGQSVRPVTE